MGNSSTKLQFVDVFFRLLTEDIAFDNKEFWSGLFSSVESIDDVFDAVGTEECVKLVVEKHKNCKILLQLILLHFQQVAAKPFPAMFASVSSSIILLTRILPLIIEVSLNHKGRFTPELSAFYSDFLWKIPPVTSSSDSSEQPVVQSAESINRVVDTPVTSSDTGSESASEAVSQSDVTDSLQVTIEPPTGSVNEAATSSSNEASETSGTVASTSEPVVSFNYSFGYCLVHSIFQLLFIPAFTIDEAKLSIRTNIPNTNSELAVFDWDFNYHLDFDAKVTMDHIWWRGLGFDEWNRSYLASSTEYDGKRTEVLRLILILMSDVLLYSEPGRNANMENSFRGIILSNDFSYVIPAFYSMFNSILAYDPIGWNLPFTAYLVSDTCIPVTVRSLYVVLALLDAKPNLSESGAELSNPYVSLIKDINGHASLEFVFRGFYRMLWMILEYYKVNGMYIPEHVGKVKNEKYAAAYAPPMTPSVTSLASGDAGAGLMFAEQELILLLWKVFEVNDNVVTYFLEQGTDFLDFVDLLLNLMIFNKKIADKGNFVRMCFFILVKLSEFRGFGLLLNLPYDRNTVNRHQNNMFSVIPTSYTDFLVLTLSKIMSSEGDRLIDMVNCGLTVLSNISPYIRGLSAHSTHLLIEMFEKYSSANYLLMKQAKFLHLLLISEVFVNIIQYQFDSNVNVLYGLARKAEVFNRFYDLCERMCVETSDDSDNLVNSEVASMYASYLGTQTLGVIRCMLNSLLPMIFKYATLMCEVKGVECTDPFFALTEAEIVEFIKDTTLVGVLPRPHSIINRRYARHKSVEEWLSLYLWSLIFVSSQEDIPIFRDMQVLLFPQLVQAETTTSNGSGSAQVTEIRADQNQQAGESESVTAVTEVAQTESEEKGEK